MRKTTGTKTKQSTTVSELRAKNDIYTDNPLSSHEFFCGYMEEKQLLVPYMFQNSEKKPVNIIFFKAVFTLNIVGRASTVKLK